MEAKTGLRILGGETPRPQNTNKDKSTENKNIQGQ